MEAKSLRFSQIGHILFQMKKPAILFEETVNRREMFTEPSGEQQPTSVTTDSTTATHRDETRQSTTPSLVALLDADELDAATTCNNPVTQDTPETHEPRPKRSRYPPIKYKEFVMQ